jgi:hypothetical protein
MKITVSSAVFISTNTEMFTAGWMIFKICFTDGGTRKAYIIAAVEIKLYQMFQKKHHDPPPPPAHFKSS